MFARTVRYFLVFLLAWLLAWSAATACADPGPAVSEPAVLAVDDAAPLAMRYRQQLDQTIELLPLLSTDAGAPFRVPEPLPSGQPPREDRSGPGSVFLAGSVALLC